MSKHQEPKTVGLEWLLHSLISFNGSGYADMNSAEDYLDSYMAYKDMRQESKAVALCQLYRIEVTPIIEKLLETTQGASHLPSEKNLKKFEVHKQQTRLLL